jgi:hypothetical protein
MPETGGPIWREITRLAGGETFQVAQSGSAAIPRSYLPPEL